MSEWCQNKKCVLGAAKGSNCSQDEDCDKLNSVEGHCSNEKCTHGKNGLDVSYYKPKECDKNNDQHPYSLHKYCGEITVDGKTSYTGYCKSINSTGKHACKSFENFNELKHVKEEEENYLRGIKYHRNFYDDTPPWDNLIQCPENDKIQINGVELCMSTMEKLDTFLGTVKATNLSSATEKCEYKYNVPHITLQSF